MAEYYVYIMSNPSRTLYTGVTNDLQRRVYEHKQKLVEGFTKRYDLTTLVYYEATSDVGSALAREKQIKGWLRRKKVALVESTNPKWRDLADGWYDAGLDSSLRSE
jgi:putative endonuclease